MAQDKMEGALPKKFEDPDKQGSTKAGSSIEQLAVQSKPVEPQKGSDMKCGNDLKESKMNLDCPARSAGIIKI